MARRTTLTTGPDVKPSSVIKNPKRFVRRVGEDFVFRFGEPNESMVAGDTMTKDEIFSGRPREAVLNENRCGTTGAHVIRR